MAWTATVDDIIAESNSDQTYANVSFSDGTRKFVRRYGIDATTVDGDLQAFAKAVITQLEGRETAAAGLTVGVITPGDKKQSQDEIDLQTFLNALKQVRIDNAAVAQKLLDPNDPTDAKKINDDYAAFKTAYSVHPDVYDKYLAGGI